VPDRVPASTAWPGVVPATPPARARVALVTGCVQDVLASSITRAAVDLLTANGVEVVMPPAQGCCGALAAHAGDMNRALGLARSLIDAFVPYLETVDAVVTTAAGCGSGIREYGLWFGEADSASRAGLLSQRTVDVSAFLARLGPLAPMRLASPARVAYQDACHLAHAQSVRREPRDLLARIEGLELVELVDGDICCGSAGIYNLEQPDIARTLGARKAATVVATRRWS